VIKDKDKALVLLSSLPDDDYETFVITIINGKKSLSYNEVLAALVNNELRRKDKEPSNSISTSALTARGRSSNCKGKDDHGRSKFRTSLKKNQCAFCREEEY